jgi:hypothetical protein
MAKKSLMTSSDMRSVTNTTTERIEYSPRNVKSYKLWLWIIGLLILGLIIFGSVSYITWQWIKNAHVTLGTGNAPPSTVTTFHIQKTGPYADLSFTVLDAQYATAFPNDTIQTESALVRVNLQVTNKSTNQASVLYYDVARLLIPGSKPIAPTNVQLPTGTKPGTSEAGWIDFPVSKGVQLSTLRLQLGSQTLGETPLIIPFSGPYDPNHLAGKTYPQTLTISYDFSGNILIYHLKSVDVLYSYRGTQAKVGQQYYVLNFTVDNNNGVMVSPGYGYDYIRLILNGYNTPPIDNSLPHDFNAGAQGVAGRVVYIGPAGLNTLNFAFLLQLVPGWVPYSVNLG